MNRQDAAIIFVIGLVAGPFVALLPGWWGLMFALVCIVMILAGLTVMLRGRP